MAPHKNPLFEGRYVTRPGSRSRKIEEMIIAGQPFMVIIRAYPNGGTKSIIEDIRGRRAVRVEEQKRKATYNASPSEIRRLHKQCGRSITEIGALLHVPYRDVIAVLDAAR